MKMTLISPYTSITFHNVRQLSSCMKKAGHEVDLVWLPAYPKTDAQLRLNARPYPETSLDSLVKLCADSDLVGISLMTEFESAAQQMTEYLRARIKAPVIWGGFHPTFAPDSSMQHADMICVGEADEALVELADAIEAGRDPAGIPAIWMRKNGSVVKGPNRPWFKDLGALPLPDCDIRSHFA